MKQTCLKINKQKVDICSFILSSTLNKTHTQFLLNKHKRPQWYTCNDIRPCKRLRLAWILFTACAGSGIIAYIIAAIVMPKKSDVI